MLKLSFIRIRMNLDITNIFTTMAYFFSAMVAGCRFPTYLWFDTQPQPVRSRVSSSGSFRCTFLK